MLYHLEGLDQLVRGIQEGESSSWCEAVRRFRPVVKRVAYSYRLDATEVDDVDQAVWLKLHESSCALRNPEALPGWIRAVARNECVNLLRRRRDVPAADHVLDAMITDSHRGDGDDIYDECLLAVRHSLEHLTDRQRELLQMMLETPAPTYEEISARMGISIGAIGPTRARAIVMLRRMPAIRELCGRGPF